EILSHRAYTTDSVKRLFEAIQKGDAPDFRPLGVLADFVEVDTAYEKAAEEFLHDELEYVVARNWEDAERGVDLMRADIQSRAAAQRLAGQYPHLYFLLPDGICYHGYALSGGKKRSSGPLALKRELRELVVSVNSKQRDLDERAVLLGNLDHKIALLEEELER